MFDVNQSLIRFWENEFDILKPKKTKKGNRLFTPQDIESYKIIFNLVREQGLTLDGAKRYLKENKTSVKHEIKSEKKQTSEIETKLKRIKKELLALSEKL
jgi:DNA-binding transcriptional MerR regulator